MFSSDSEITLTILISTTLLLFFGAVIIYFLFRYQRKRQQHEKEMLRLKESYNQTLLKSKMEIQEQTLDHIAKELHSNIGHLASLININMAEILERSEESQRENAIETKSLAKQLLAELKALSTALNTDYIMKIGFDRALEKELQRVTKTMKFPATLTKSGSPFSLRPDREIILFRLCQEVINNTVKYAEAEHLYASIVYEEDTLIVGIEDDGNGFDIESAEDKSESTGMINIRVRAQAINSTIKIQSEIGKGTVVSIKVPKL